MGAAASCRGPYLLSIDPMRILAPAVGAALAAILESSVLAHLQMGEVKPDLVFALGIAVAMVLGFDSGMTWAFVGGVMLDVLTPERALGSAAISLLLCTALALLAARALWPPRLAFIGATVFGLTYLYHVALLALLAFTSGVGFQGLSITSLTIVAIMNAAIAGVAVLLVRALDLRFGEPERLAW